MNRGIKVLQTLALPLGYGTVDKEKVYEAIYLFLWCLRAESNHRHGDFQSPALPTELQRQNGDLDGARTHDL